MKKIFIVLIFSMLGFVACNNAGNGNADGTTPEADTTSISNEGYDVPADTLPTDSTMVEPPLDTAIH